MSRRSFLTVLGGTAAALSLASTQSACDSNSAKGLRIAIVGGGLAGLHCAYRLQRQGIYATVYEGANRLGGRVLTHSQGWPDGQNAELGGAFIDSTHQTMRSLVSELELTLDDVGQHAGALKPTTWRIDQAFVTDAQITEAFAPLAPVITNALNRLRADASFKADLDAQSIAEWLDAQAEADAFIKKIINLVYCTQHGVETSEQSAINLIESIDASRPDPFSPFGARDERYRIDGGNDRIVRALAAQLDGQIETSCILRAMRKPAGQSRYTLTFERARGNIDVDADHVVLALPFSTLRSVEIDAELTADKQRCIDELGYGAHTQLLLGFSSHPWQLSPHFASGNAYANNALGRIWDASLGQPGSASILTRRVGGQGAAALGAGTVEERAAETATLIDDVFSGASAAYRAGDAQRMQWSSYPFSLGSNACYLRGQLALRGIEQQRQGNVHFAGEHCVSEHRGTMEGALASGAQAAAEILSDLSLASQT